MQYVQEKEMLDLVNAYQSTLEILTPYVAWCPECVVNSDCLSDKACQRNKCINPCPGTCGINAVCQVLNHIPTCTCIENYIGDRCDCSCLPGMIGSPPNCRPECIRNADCPTDKACRNQKCVDPCPGLCGRNAYCNVRNHIPICICENGFIGDPFSSCYRPTSKFVNNFG